jgi:uncharacterized membrane protein YqjE
VSEIPGQKSASELVREVTDQVSRLAQAELELARLELRADLRRELAAMAGLGLAGLLAFWGVTFLLLSLVWSLATVMASWLAALLVGGALVIAAALAFAVGWSRRVKQPLSQTLQTLAENLRWARRRVA